MSDKSKSDWEPGSKDVLKDQVAAYDKMREECPCAPLARTELKIVVEELLGYTASIQLLANNLPIRATFPASGFSALPLMINDHLKQKST